MMLLLLTVTVNACIYYAFNLTSAMESFLDRGVPRRAVIRRVDGHSDEFPVRDDVETEFDFPVDLHFSADLDRRDDVRGYARVPAVIEEWFRRRQKRHVDQALSPRVHPQRQRRLDPHPFLRAHAHVEVAARRAHHRH